MTNRIATVLMAGTIAVAAAGTGVAIGSATAGGVKACSSNAGHKLGLIKNGRCAHGFKKVTIGAQGPRGKVGPQGPGAIEQELTVPGDDIQRTFAHNVAGMAVHASCTAAGNPSLDLETVDSSDKLDFSGTQASDGAIAFAAEHQVTNTLTISGLHNAGFDLVVRAGTGPFVELRVSAVQSGTTCLDWEVAVPTTAVS